MNLEKVKELIPNHTPGYFATISGDKPELRGWQFQLIEGDKVYFVTGNSKNVYKEMQQNPNVSFACSASGYFFRISGKVTFVTDKNIKQKIYDTLTEQVTSMYKNIDDNGFSVFYVSNGEIKYAKGFAPFQSFKF